MSHPIATGIAEAVVVAFVGAMAACGARSAGWEKPDTIVAGLGGVVLSLIAIEGW